MQGNGQILKIEIPEDELQDMEEDNIYCVDISEYPHPMFFDCIDKKYISVYK